MWKKIKGPPGIATALAILIFTACAFYGIDSDQQKDTNISRGMLILDERPKTKYIVWKPVKEVKKHGFGRVLLKTETGRRFSALVIPMKQLEIGSIITVSHVSYMSTVHSHKDFYIVD